METDRIKDVWRRGMNTHIASYSEAELNGIVVKAARKAMKPIQLGGIFQWIVVAVMIYITGILIFRDNSLEMKLLDFSGLVILLLCFLGWKHSDYKMNKYTCDMPVKAWLEYRIRELNKTMYTRKKYNVLIMGGAFLLGFGFHVVSQLILKAPFNPLFSGSLFIGLLLYLLLVGRSLEKKYKKTLEELDGLYKQMDESFPPA